MDFSNLKNCVISFAGEGRVYLHALPESWKWKPGYIHLHVPVCLCNIVPVLRGLRDEWCSMDATKSSYGFKHAMQVLCCLQDKSTLELYNFHKIRS